MEILGIIIGIILGVAFIYYSLILIGWAILAFLHIFPMIMRLCFVVLVIWLAVKAVIFIGTLV